MSKATGTSQSGRLRRRGRARLVGLGLDGHDGHVRVTFSDEFRLVGGSSETHVRMQAAAREILAEFAAEGVSLENLSYAQYLTLAERINGAIRSEETTS